MALYVADCEGRFAFGRVMSVYADWAFAVCVCYWSYGALRRVNTVMSCATVSYFSKHGRRLCIANLHFRVLRPAPLLLDRELISS